MMDNWERYKVTGKILPAETEHWKIEQFVAEGEALKRYNSMCFIRGDEDMMMKEGQYTRLVRKGMSLSSGMMMSDTKMEIEDHLQFIQKARGDVLVNGLGLGMVLNGLVNVIRPNLVAHVDIVEIDEEVISMVAPYFEDDPRVTIHHADAFTMQWPKGTSWDYVWHDIWPTISPDDIKEHRSLFRKYKNLSRFQRAWRHEYLKRNTYQGQWR
jgi:hypothetical protein